MKDKTSEFINILDIEAQNTWSELKDITSKSNIQLFEIQFGIKMDEDVKKSFGLNEDIKFVLNMSYETNMEYWYKNIPVKPECYYIRPDDYHDVPLLRILQECIIQDKHNPDIKYLERGETVNVL